MRRNKTATTRKTRPTRSGLMPAAVLGLLVACLPGASPRAQYGDAAADLAATAVPEGAAWARIRHVEGPFTLYQSDAGRLDEGAVNAPVLPGDILETGRGGRAEVQLANGSIVWLDGRSRLNVLTLADGRSRYENQTLLSLEAGALAVQVEPFSGQEELFRIDTPASTVYLLEEGLYRIDGGTGSGTRVAARRGVAEVLAAERSVLVRSGEGTFVNLLGPPETPSIVRVLDQDAFDEFVSARRQRFLRQDAATYVAYQEEIPVEVRPYLVEMEAYGSWNVHPSYGAIWVPRVTVGWRPYTYGYWQRRPLGHVWVSYDPWGYAPYHYGRWEYLGGYGWCWMPGAVYAPAWVSWGYSGSYIGWAPLGWYNYPSGWSISIGFGAFHASYWNFVDYGHFHHHHVQRVLVKDRALAPDMVYASRPPRSAQAHSDEEVRLRQAAIFARARNDARRASPQQVAGRNSMPQERLTFRQNEVQAASRARTTGRQENRVQTTARSQAARGNGAGGTRQIDTSTPRRILTDTSTRRAPQSTTAAPGRGTATRRPERAATPSAFRPATGSGSASRAPQGSSRSGRQPAVNPGSSARSSQGSGSASRAPQGSTTRRQERATPPSASRPATGSSGPSRPQERSTTRRTERATPPPASRPATGSGDPARQQQRSTPHTSSRTATRAATPQASSRSGRTPRPEKPAPAAAGGGKESKPSAARSESRERGREGGKQDRGSGRKR